MNKPKLQREQITPAGNVPVAAGEILEIRDITLKEALKVVRSLADHTRSDDFYPQQQA